MRPILLLLAAVVTSAGALTGCQATGPALAGRTFLSVGVSENGAPKPLVAGTRIRLEFKDGAVTASAGCNTMGGSYRTDAGRLIVGDLYTTAMGCQADLSAQDTWLMQVLGAKPTLLLVGDELTIDAGAAALVLKDRRVIEPDLPLTGTTWTVDTIFSGDTAAGVPEGALATLVFHADGTVDVNAGCNTGSARWAVAGAGIDVRDLGLTKKACPGAAGEVETAVVTTLRAGTIGAAIEAGRLILRAGATGLGLRAT